MASVVGKKQNNTVIYSYAYTYDGNGNIATVNDGTHTTTYTYDSANQLIREDNAAAGKTWRWEYDNAGNITHWYEYAHTTGTVGAVLADIAYGYGDNSWGDLLTAYGSQSITHDNAGNPLDDTVWTYTWERGRQLQKMSKKDNTAEWTFTYDADGMRIGRTNGTTTYGYTYNGSQLTQMTVGSDTLTFTYDANGAPLTVTYGGTTYYYATNLQGDVTAILNSTGTKVVTYTYDAWGNILNSDEVATTTLGTLNPLRYRGYVYDHETGLYYLQSRYYNPEVGRFINADAFTSTGQGLLGNNMFAYCNNNPVVRNDESGEFWNFVVGAVVGAVIGVLNTVVEAVKEDGWSALTSGKTWAKAGVSAVCGAINGTVAASGASMLIGGFVGGATGFVESLSHELIDNDGTMTSDSWATVATDTAVGFMGGLAGGNGAIHGNKYMANQITRLKVHQATDGFKKAGIFFFKMTANYSKPFISKTLLGIAKGWLGGKAVEYLLT